MQFEMQLPIGLVIKKNTDYTFYDTNNNFLINYALNNYIAT